MMVLFSLISLGNTFLRFFEISEFNREQFSLCQNKDRRDKSEIALQENIKNYTLVSYNEIEMMRCQKPNGPDLMLALFQKFIFDFTYGIYVATAGMNLYAVFDFLTFQETLEDGHSIMVQDLSFALQSNARLPLMTLATG